MEAIFQVFVDVIGVFIGFVQDYLIPADASSVTILHVAIWGPTTLGLLAGTVAFLKGLWSSRRSRA